MFKINLKKNNILTFSQTEAKWDISQQVGDKWKNHVYHMTSLEKKFQHFKNDYIKG